MIDNKCDILTVVPYIPDVVIPNTDVQDIDIPEIPEVPEQPTDPNEHIP